MTLPVMEFQDWGYKIRMIFAYPEETENWTNGEIK